MNRIWIALICIVLTGFVVYQVYQYQTFSYASTEVYVLCAGSLTNVINQSATEFMRLNPSVSVFFSPYGSLECVQRLKSGAPCDLIAVSDWNVINSGLYGVKMPGSAANYADWYVVFAKNAMCIAVPKGNPAGINENNWYQKIIDANSSSFWGRAMPYADPCGYRTLLVFKLAEKNYNSPGLADMLANRTKVTFQPKEFDLMHMVALGQLQAVFTYESLAMQFAEVGDGVDFVQLPDQINLGNTTFEDSYGAVAVNFQTPAGEWVSKRGTAIMYAFTIPNTAKNKYWAIKFSEFLLSNSKVLMENYQIPVTPPVARGDTDVIPFEIKNLCRVGEKDE